MIGFFLRLKCHFLGFVRLNFNYVLYINIHVYLKCTLYTLNIQIYVQLVVKDITVFPHYILIIQKHVSVTRKCHIHRSSYDTERKRHKDTKTHRYIKGRIQSKVTSSLFLSEMGAKLEWTQRTTGTRKLSPTQTNPIGLNMHILFTLVRYTYKYI